ncbi:enolase C-terminal domain-like protein [uncultured Pontibacter sp.]|uniref:enolase C-terminal domain-like protein n=1 Tax=uncultured Pontibacter sp. TaxID=453356 RepID=UPI002636CC5D|nr:enolase C-terminal domain-like protein [uncultured Pontibacter sp.]
MLTWHIEALHLKLKYKIKAAACAGEDRVNFLVQVSDGSLSGFGEAAPQVRFGETPELLLQQYQVLLMAGLVLVKNLEDLHQLLLEHQPINSLRFAVEAAYIHYYCQLKSLPVNQVLGQRPPHNQPTSFSLPAMEPELALAYMQQQRINRFCCLKLRVTQDTDVELVNKLLRASERPVMLEGSESWSDPDKLLAFLRSLDKDQVISVEQPMPASQGYAYAHLKNKTPIPIIADESITHEADFELLREEFHGVNIKLMKAGGYLNALRLMREARKYGLMTMIGSMVETSLGIWCAMQLSSGFDFANLDGFLMLTEEPFKLVKEQNGILYLK